MYRCTLIHASSQDACILPKLEAISMLRMHIALRVGDKSLSKDFSRILFGAFPRVIMLTGFNFGVVRSEPLPQFKVFHIASFHAALTESDKEVIDTFFSFPFRLTFIDTYFNRILSNNPFPTRYMSSHSRSFGSPSTRLMHHLLFLILMHKSDM